MMQQIDQSVFISYSRRDKVFVQRLVAALKDSGKEVWVDWNSIPFSVEWWREIERGIEGAEALLFVVSPSALASEMCNRELSYAQELNKRIIPLIRQKPEADVLESLLEGRAWADTAEANWDLVKKLNWLFFRRKQDCECDYDYDLDEIAEPACDAPECDHDDFDASFKDLLETVDTDFEYIREHTRLLLRAKEWDAEQAASKLLRGTDLSAAQTWLNSGANQQVRPTPLHTQYISASQIAQNRRQRTVFSSGVVILIVLTLLTVLSLVLFRNEGIQRQRADDGATQVADERDRADEGATQVAQERDRADAGATQAAEERDRANAGATQVAQELQRNLALRLASEANFLLQSDSGNAEAAALLAVRSLNTNYTTQGYETLVKALPALHARQIWPVSGIGTAYAPDGTRIAYIDRDQVVVVLDVTTQEPIQQFPVSSSGDGWSELVFSPDSRYLAGGFSSRRVLIWDLSTGEEVFSAWADGLILALEFSPDGKLIAAGTDEGTAFLWDVATGDDSKQFSFPQSVWGVTFSPDGNYLFTGLGLPSESDTDAVGRISMLDWRFGMETVQFPIDGGGLVTSLARSPTGNWLAAGTFDGDIFIWDTTTVDVVHALHASNAPVLDIDWTQDGTRFATAHGMFEFNDDHAIRVWDAQTGQVVQTLTGHTYGVFTVDLAPDGTAIISSSSDGSTRLWDVEPSLIDGAEIGQGEFDYGVRQVVFSPDERYMAVLALAIVEGTTDGGAPLHSNEASWVYDTVSGAKVLSLENVESMFYMPDSQSILAVSYLNVETDRQTARLIDIASGVERLAFDGAPGKRIQRVLFPPQQDYMLVFEQDRGPVGMSFDEPKGAATVWDLVTGEQRAVLNETFSSDINGVDMSADGSRIVAGGTGGARVWEAATGTQLQHLAYGRVLDVALSDDGQYLLAEVDGFGEYTVSITHVTSGQVLASLAHEERPSSVGFNGAYAYATVGFNDSTEILLWSWNPDEGTQTHTLKAPQENIRFSFSGVLRGSPYVFAASVQFLYVWDLNTGNPVNTFATTFLSTFGTFFTTLTTGQATSGRTTDIPADALFSADGQYLVTGRLLNEGAALWDVATGKKLRTLAISVSEEAEPEEGGFVGAATFSPQDTYIVTSDLIVENIDLETNTVTGPVLIARLWILDPLTAACERLLRDLSAEERELYDIQDDGPTCPQMPADEPENYGPAIGL